MPKSQKKQFSKGEKKKKKINIYTRSPVYPYENHPSLICVWIITDEVGKQE